MNIEIRSPVALRGGIKELIDAHYGVAEDISFMNKYPEVYQFYLQLSQMRRGRKAKSESKQGENGRHTNL